MPCACEQCQQHAKTLGLEATASRDSIHRAYRDAAKQWHPDRFESDPAHQPEAEEHFKQLQIAYRVLTEHDEHPFIELTAIPYTPASEEFFKSPAPRAQSKPAATTGAPGLDSETWESTNLNQPQPARSASAAPQVPFGNLPGCFTGPHFPPHAAKVIDAHLGREHTALAIVDLTRAGAASGELSQFMLLASHGVLLRDILNMVSLLWYPDLGEITMVDQRRNGKLGLWQRLLEKISGSQHKYALHIHRRNGAHFCTIAGEADDSVKKVIYNFLLRKKYEAQP